MIRIYVRFTNCGAWEHYGDCSPHQMANELAYIRQIGLYVQLR